MWRNVSWCSYPGAHPDQGRHSGFWILWIQKPLWNLLRLSQIFGILPDFWDSFGSFFRFLGIDSLDCRSVLWNKIVCLFVDVKVKRKYINAEHVDTSSKWLGRGLRGRGSRIWGPLSSECVPFDPGSGRFDNASFKHYQKKDSAAYNLLICIKIVTSLWDHAD